eukprot:SAG31_NODE_628_length_13432_cov_131.456086_13_plen_1393_part_00
MTTEGWSTIFSPLLNVASNHFVVYAYFISLIFVTSFFMVNFVMAQMVVAFARAVHAQNHMRPPDLSSVELVWRAIRKTCQSGDTDKTTDVWAMRDEFNAVDRDHSGELDEDEIAELAERLGMKLSLSEMDANNDGTIGYPEFEGWWRMRGLFDKFDIDGSGSLDPDEARNLAQKLGTEFSLEEMDTDDDGGIEYHEFAAWWNMRHKFNEFDVNEDQSLGPDEIEKLAQSLNMKIDIADLDRDGDGDITYTEFETWFQVQRAFTKLDQDGSGTLDAEEVLQLSALLKTDLDMSTLDSDGSGSVDIKEFEVWWNQIGKYKKSEIRKLAVAAEFEFADPGLRGFVSNRWFNHVVLVVVVLNFIVLAMDHHLIDHDWLLAIEYANLGFTMFFLVELIFKLAALQLEFFSDRFNVLDFFVVALSLLELAFGSDGAFSVMRSLRLLRTFKVFAASQSLRKLLQVTMKGGAAIMNFGVLLFFFLVIYALVGMHFFGTEFSSPVYDAPGKFDSFYWAFLTVFQVLTRENWHELLYVGYGSPAGWTTFVYFGSLIVITNYIILSLFLGNMLHNLQEVFLREAKKLQHAAAMKTGLDRLVHRHGDTKATVIGHLAAFALVGDLTISDDLSDEEKRRRGTLIIQKMWAKYRLRKLVQHEQAVARGEIEEPEVEEEELPVEPMACFIFAEDNALRELFVQLNANDHWNAFIMLCIAVSSITLAFEHPENDPDTAFAWELFILDVILTLIFVFEMFTKMIARGVIMAPSAYLRDTWDQMDFVIVVVSVIGLFPFAHEYKMLRVLRTFRVLRPLRTLRRFPQLAAITATLISSLVPVGIVAFIASFVVAMFAVLWVALQKGKLYQCTADENDYIKFSDCVSAGGQWKNSSQNFDNIFSSLLTLFEVMTMEDWQGVMYASIDTTNTETFYRETYERETRGTWWWGILYMVFIMIGAFFFLNLVVGVVVNAFDMADKMNQTQADRDEAATRKQTKMITRASPIYASGYYTGLRDPLYNLLVSQAWDIAIAVCIILNVVCMACEHAEQATTTTDVLYGLNIVFTLIFTVELIVKIIALHPTRCFADQWNTFDAIIVFFSILELAIDVLGNDFPVPINPMVLRAFRVFRLTRLLKLVPHSEGLQAVFHTFVEALPVLTNVGMLLFLVFFMYGVLALQLFASVKPEDPVRCAEDDCEMTIGFMNFTSFGTTLFTLFILATGEHWNAIMHELMKAPDPAPGPLLTVVFFLSFQFLCVFLTLNLFISVVVAYTQKADEEKFARQQAGEEGLPPEELTLEDVDSYTRAWIAADPNAQGSVEGVDKVREVVSATAWPLGSGGDDQKTEEILEWIRTESTDGGQSTPRIRTVFFSALLNSLANRAFGLNGDAPSPASPSKRVTQTNNPLNDEDAED